LQRYSIKGNLPIFSIYSPGELSLILKNKNFPDYFGSCNNSALIKKAKKMVVHFNYFSAVEFDDLSTL